jgi:glycosyltransferase involved in cell wall biosynthesis
MNYIHNNKTKLSILLWTWWYTITQRQHHWAREISRSGHDLTIATTSSIGNIIRKYSPLRYFTHPVNWHQPEQNAKIICQFSPPFTRFKLVNRLHIFKKYLFLKKLFSGHYGDFDVCIIGHPMRIPQRNNVKILIYDVVDDFPEMYKVFGAHNNEISQIEELEMKLSSEADIIWTVSEPLYNKFVEYFPNKTYLIPNACEYERFASPFYKGVVLPKGFPENGRPIAGYIGAIDVWFDWETLIYCCKLLKDVNFVLIGNYSKNVNNKLINRFDLNNLFLLGQKEYGSLPLFLNKFKVGLIPRKSKLIASMSPIKLYEYLATGLPVVSAPMPDCCKYCSPGIVWVADSPNKFALYVSEALNMASDVRLIERRKEIGKENSWEKRWKLCEETIINKILESKA